MEDEMIEQNEQLEQMGQTTDDVFETPVIEVPATPPEVHHGTVTGVTLRRLNNDKQTSIISIGLVSRDVPTLEKSLDVFVPKLWEESIADLSQFKASDLPSEKGNNQKFSYQSSIANSDRTARLQRYVFNKESVYTNSKGKEVTVKDSIARAAGRNPIDLGLKLATDLETYTENVNKMLQGLDVLFTMKERGGDDPAFAHQLQIQDLFSPDEYDVNPKRFKSFSPAWDVS
jgi:hypothetical protein